MKDLERRRADIEGLGAVALGISVDSVPCKKAWAASMGVSGTALLADFWPHGRVAQAYGIFHEEFGFSRRAVFIVNEEGRITWRKIYPTKQVPDIVEILENLEEDTA
jgi:peroxiredoxin